MNSSRIILNGVKQLSKFRNNLTPLASVNISHGKTYSTVVDIPRQTVTVIPGDGTGPELIHSLRDIFTAAAVPVDFEEVYVSEISSLSTSMSMKS